MTSILLWTSLNSSLASVVMIVQVQTAPLRRDPCIVKSREPERLARLQPNVNGDLSSPLLKPLKEAISNYQAPVLLEGRAENRLYGDCLGSGVDHPAADREVF
jgi:hypothetical protein